MHFHVNMIFVFIALIIAAQEKVDFFQSFITNFYILGQSLKKSKAILYDHTIWPYYMAHIAAIHEFDSQVKSRLSVHGRLCVRLSPLQT